jgi:RNA polymerase sigma-70 factor (ECF subfamily)
LPTTEKKSRFLFPARGSWYKQGANPAFLAIREVVMPDPQPSFPALVERLRTGDAGAAEMVFHRFSHRLIGLARARMEERIRRKVDPEDVVQSAFKSFFRRQAENEFDLKDWEGLWALLTVIVLRKCGRRAEYYRAFCRDVRREHAPAANDGASIAGWEAVARDPTPDEAVVMAETVAGLFGALDEQGRSIVQLALQGWRAGEIGAELGIALRSVYRNLERVRLLLEQPAGAS